MAQINVAQDAWTVFNSAGAVVRDNCSLDTVRDYMTPERLERGWNAVLCINVTSQAQLDALSESDMSDTEKAAIQAAFAAHEAIQKAIDAYEAADFGSHVTDILRGALSDLAYSIKEATS